MLDELTHEAESFVREGTDEEPEIERWTYMRYAGQGWEIPVQLPDGSFDGTSHELLSMRFEKAYSEFFGRPIDGLAIEAVSWAVRVASPRPPAELVARIDHGNDPDSGPSPTTRTRPIHDAATESITQAGIIERDSLQIGQAIHGPAVIVETQTTTLIASDQSVVVQPDGCLLIKVNTLDEPTAQSIGDAP